MKKLVSHTLLRTACATLAIAALAACGGDSTGPSASVASVELNVPEQLVRGETMTLLASARDANGNRLTGRQVTWASSNEAVVSVSARGEVNARADGTARITATVEDKTASVEVTVVAPTLRNWAARRNFWIGAAVGSRFPWHQDYMRVLRSEYNVVVAENAMKMSSLRPTRTSWNWAWPDQMVDSAVANGQRIRGHTLAWHSQAPSWVTGATWPRAEAVQVLEEHIAAVVGRWKGKIYAWDVVNEAINDSGVRRPESPWQRMIGNDYLEIAFRAAAAADPDARLFYNDYGIEGRNTKQDTIFAILSDLRLRGVPVHGIGLQGHYTLSSGFMTDVERLKATMDRFASIGLRVEITELDIGISGTVTPQALDQQAAFYREIVRTCREHPACDTVVLWGVDDDTSWRRGASPLIFDAQYQPKPAYHALINYFAGN
jgi:endo-1,4-beta-xylanase